MLGDDAPEVRRARARRRRRRRSRPARAARLAACDPARLPAASTSRPRVAAAEAILGDRSVDASFAARPRRFPGRLQVVAHDPLTIYDGAHNAPGIAALAASVPEGTVAVLSILDDKDAAAMLRALLPRLTRRRLHPRAEPAGAAAGHAGRPREQGRRRASPRSSPIRAAPSSAHESLQARTEPCSRQARSTWLPNCSVHPAQRRASAL